MKFTVKIPGMTLYPGTARHWWQDATAADVRRAVRSAEEWGFEYVTVPEHVILNRDWAEQMGTRWVHSLSATGVLLGATTRIKVVCLVVVPYHNPIELAKAIATLDYLSDGRIVVQALVGYNEWEYRALGVPFEHRGALTNESLGAMQSLWYDEAPEFAGRFVQITPDFVLDPKPTGHVPIWMGGGTDATLRRVARLGDGWVSSFPFVSRAEFPKKLEYLYAQPEYRDNVRPLDFGMHLFEGERDLAHKVVKQAEVRMNVDYVLEQVAEISALGATVTSANEVLGTGQYQNDDPDALAPTTCLDEWLDRLQWFAENVKAVSDRA